MKYKILKGAAFSQLGTIAISIIVCIAIFSAMAPVKIYASGHSAPVTVYSFDKKKSMEEVTKFKDELPDSKEELQILLLIKSFEKEKSITAVNVFFINDLSIDEEIDLIEEKITNIENSDKTAKVGIKQEIIRVEEAQAAEEAEAQRIKDEEVRAQARMARETSGTQNVCDPNASFYSWEPQLYNTETGVNGWSRSSGQYRVNAQAYTNDEGYTMVDGYYLVAMGNEYGPVGRKYKIEFSSGQTLDVMLGDTKGDRCTHVGGSTGSMLEFIVDTKTSKAMPWSELSKGNLSIVRGTIVSITEYK